MIGAKVRNNVFDIGRSYVHKRMKNEFAKNGSERLRKELGSREKNVSLTEKER